MKLKACRAMEETELASGLPHAVESAAQPCEHVIADGTGPACHLVDADAFAQQRHPIAALPVPRQIGDVAGHEIHRYASNERAALPVPDGLAAAPRIGRPDRARIAVRVADRDDGNAGCPLRGPGRTVADGRTARND